MKQLLRIKKHYGRVAIYVFKLEFKPPPQQLPYTETQTTKKYYML